MHSDQIFSRRTIVLFQPEPETVRGAYRTANGTQINPALMDEKTNELLDLIENATRAGHLCLERAWNSRLEISGIVIGSSRRDGVATILAELLRPSSREEAHEWFEMIGWAASERKLSAILHTNVEIVLRSRQSSEMKGRFWFPPIWRAYS